MRKIKFLGTGDGITDNGVHFASPLGNDFTLCELTMDSDNQTTGEFEETKESVDCGDCSTIINFCKKVKKNEL